MLTHFHQGGHAYFEDKVLLLKQRAASSWQLSHPLVSRGCVISGCSDEALKTQTALLFPNPAGSALGHRKVTAPAPSSPASRGQRTLLRSSGTRVVGGGALPAALGFLAQKEWEPSGPSRTPVSCLSPLALQLNWLRFYQEEGESENKRRGRPTAETKPHAGCRSIASVLSQS